MAQWVRLLDYLTTHTSLSPIRRGFAPSFVNYKKGCTRLAAASDKVYQLLTHGWWFSPGTPASSTTKTGRYDIAEILLKVALNTINQSISFVYVNKTFEKKPLNNIFDCYDVGTVTIRWIKCEFRFFFISLGDISISRSSM